MIPINSVIYQIVTDRFDNEEGDLYKKIERPDYNKIFDDYLGGTFNGIRKHLDYIENLGVTHVLLSPVQESTKYHGYHVKDNFAVNPRFGTEKDLKDLIEDFHKRNIRVMLDYVSTHILSSNPLFNQEEIKNNDEKRKWFLFKDIGETNPEYRSYYSELIYKITSGNPEKIEETNPQGYLSYFGLKDLPLLNLENPEVIEWHKKCLDFWITQYGFNDIRLDSGFIQPKPFISDLTNYVKKHGDINVIVENWDFEHSGQDCFGLCDGEFDVLPTLWFNKYPETEDFFRKLEGHYHRTKHNVENNYSLILSLDNHDLPRFKGNKELQKILATIQFTLLPVPLIYYGNEICMQQYNDGKDRLAQSRDPMRFDLLDDDMINFYKKLISFRKNVFTNGTKLAEFGINDDSNLFSFMGNDEKNYFYVITNTEKRDKPVILSELFKGREIKTLRQSLQQVIGNTDLSSFLIRAESPYILQLVEE